MDQHRKTHAWIVAALALGGLIVAALLPPIGQPESLHRFADARALGGIPNAANVLSNLFILMAGAYGLWVLGNPFGGGWKPRLEHPADAWPYAVFFVATVLTAFGSAWYHWHPDNLSLAWDRAPMSLMLAAFLAMIAGERLDRRLGSALLVLLSLAGLASVIYWIRGELAGAGDLRPYLYLHLWLLLPAGYALFALPSRYSRSNRFGWALVLYLAAKAAEVLDAQLFALLGGVVGGHTIKHLLAAAAIALIADQLARRVPVRRTPAPSAFEDF